MNEIKTAVINFVEALPPLLQLIFGMILAMGCVKVIMIVADIIEAKKKNS